MPANAMRIIMWRRVGVVAVRASAGKVAGVPVMACVRETPAGGAGGLPANGCVCVCRQNARRRRCRGARCIIPVPDGVSAAASLVPECAAERAAVEVAGAVCNNAPSQLRWWNAATGAKRN